MIYWMVLRSINIWLQFKARLESQFSYQWAKWGGCSCSWSLCKDLRMWMYWQVCCRQSCTRRTFPSPHIFLCAEFVLFLANQVVDESSFTFHVERNLLDGEKGVFSKQCLCFSELSQGSPSTEMLDKGLSPIAGICWKSDLDLCFTYHMMWFQPT